MIKKKENLPKVFLFHQIGYLFKPLWTYAIESKNIQVAIYFYATGIERPKFKNIVHSNLYKWDLINWNNYLVWDKYQKNFILKYSQNKPNINITGPIFFQAQKKFKNKSNESIALFDIQPFRDSRYKILGEDIEYYTPDTSLKFLNDILNVIGDSKLKIFHKKKRNIGKYRSIKYLNNIT